MAVRNIVKIDESKCNGCGDCVTSCAEGAIAIIDGKAKLVSEIYCDGLGACLGTCPMDAITIEQREADEFDEKATEEYLAKQKPQSQKPGGEFVCPGSMARQMNKPQADSSDSAAVPSQLTQWPVQMGLVSPQAPYFKNADLLLVADCVPFAMGDFHNKILKGKAIAVGCPKLDDDGAYVDKLASIIQQNDLNSLSVIHMEVPCCFGLTQIAKEAIAKSGSDLTFDDVTIGLDGTIQGSEKM